MRATIRSLPPRPVWAYEIGRADPRLVAGQCDRTVPLTSLWLAVTAVQTSVYGFEFREVGASVKSTADFVPEVSPCGGEDVSLEVRPSVTGQYYGYGWLGGKGVTRTKKFDILWQDSQHIRSGDTATILIATLDDASLNVWSSGYSIVHENNSWGWRRQGSSSPTDWLTLRVEIRASEFDGAWEHHYRFRLTSDRKNFEIEEM